MTAPVTNHAQQSALRRDRWIRIRILVVAGCVVVGFGVVIGRAADLHLREQASLKWVAKKQYRAVIPTAPRRGKILDAKGRELAIDLPVHSIYADPRGIRDVEAAVAALDPLLPLGNEWKGVVQRLRQAKKFVWIQRQLPLEVVDTVRALKIPGIHFVEETKRFYPNGSLAGQILGAVGLDAEPLGGIELAKTDLLASQQQPLVYQRDAKGRVFYTPTTAQADDDVGTVELTIDKVIQHHVEGALQMTLTATQARSVTAVVVEVATGRVLAMASLPNFDPNDYTRYNQQFWRNRAVTDTIEPGSTFKVFIAAAALEAGMDPERKFDCERGAITIGNAVLHDHDPYGMLSLADIIRVSSNIGALKVAQAIGRETFAAMLQGFRIGEPTGIDFPGEVGGRLRAAATWQPVEMATIAFGQGLATTPLQMVMAIAAIANGGQLMRPYLVERVRKADGTVIETGQPTVVATPIQPATARRLTTLLQRVVEKGGTGTLAASTAYPVAGKTGTAQKVVEGTGRYAVGRYFASFVGFAPAESPRVAIFVGVDEPKGPYFGGVVAAPAFKEIAEATLQYLGVPAHGAPMLVTNEGPRGASGAPAMQVSVPTVASLPIDRDPIFDRVDGKQVRVPRLVGLPLRQVVRAVGAAGIPLQIAGTGIAVAQEPAAGTVISPATTVAVRCALPE